MLPTNYAAPSSAPSKIAMARMANNLNPTNMYSEVVMVTVPMANEWIARMAEQRHIRPGRIFRYCKSRVEGNWMLTHQSLAFDVDGHLIDGQHRLQMVINTGLETPFYVTYNVPSGSVLQVDGGLGRNDKDAIKMAGEGDYSAQEISIARIYETAPATTSTNQKPDKNEIIRIMQTYGEAIAFTQNNLPVQPGLNRAVRTLIARAYYHVDHNRLKEWCHVISTGMTVSANPTEDFAAVTFSRYLMRARANGGTESAEMERYYKGQTALMYFVERRSVDKLMGTNRDLFPVKRI